MKLGLDVGIYGPLATPANVMELARIAEDAGFDSVWLADHVVFPRTVESRYPYAPSGKFPVPAEDPILEPIATMGVLAGATKRVRIGTAVLVIPYRNPVVLGKMLATYDAFTGGRIILGAGVGWLEEEFEILDTAPFAARGRVTDEYLEIVKRICAGGEVSYEGEHYRFDPLLSYPRSVQRPHPPILIGGTSMAALRRVARLGDGWLSVGLSLDNIEKLLKKLANLCQGEGRDLADLDLHHKLFLGIGAERRGVDGEREPGTGTRAQVRDDFKRVRDLGFGNAIVRYIGQDLSRQEEQLKMLIDDILPAI